MYPETVHKLGTRQVFQESTPPGPVPETPAQRRLQRARRAPLAPDIVTAQITPSSDQTLPDEDAVSTGGAITLGRPPDATPLSTTIPRRSSRRRHRNSRHPTGVIHHLNPAAGCSVENPSLSVRETTAPDPYRVPTGPRPLIA